MSKKKVVEKADGALFKEDIPGKMHTSDVWMNKNKGPEPNRKGLEFAGEEDTLMGRLAKRMGSRDYIDTLQTGFGKKANRAKFADMADLGLPHAMRLGGEIAPEVVEGIAVEKEHTDDPAIAKKIAEDHLKEDKKYYKKLKTLGL